VRTEGAASGQPAETSDPVLNKTTTAIGGKAESQAIDQSSETSDPVLKKAKTVLAAKMEDPASVEFVDIKRAVNKIGHRSRSFVAMSKAKRIRVKPPTRDLSCISQRRMRRLSSVETKIQWRRSCIAPNASARIAS